MKLLIVLIFIYVQILYANHNYEVGDCFRHNNSGSWANRTACVVEIITNSNSLLDVSNNGDVKRSKCNYVVSFKDYASKSSIFVCDYIDQNTSKADSSWGLKFDEAMTDAYFMANALIDYRIGRISINEYRRIIEFYLENPLRAGNED